MFLTLKRNTVTKRKGTDANQSDVFTGLGGAQATTFATTVLRLYTVCDTSKIDPALIVSPELYQPLLSLALGMGRRFLLTSQSRFATLGLGTRRPRVQ